MEAVRFEPLAAEAADKKAEQLERAYPGRFMGDGILANFGFLRAHEDDAERAVRAGLASFCRIGRWDRQKNLI